MGGAYRMLVIRALPPSTVRTDMVLLISQESRKFISGCRPNRSQLFVMSERKKLSQITQTFMYYPD